jgi:hypothetical protein
MNEAVESTLPINWARRKPSSKNGIPNGTVWAWTFTTDPNKVKNKDT